MFEWDLNKDGIVDAIGFAGMPYWIAPEFTDSVNNPNARLLTPEIMDQLTQHRNLSLRLSKMLTTQAYNTRQRDSL